MRTKAIPDCEEIIHAYMVERAPMKELGKRWGVTPDYVRKLARKCGCPPRSRKGLSALKKARPRMDVDLTNKQRQVLVGSLLGDGTLSDPKRCGPDSFTQSYLRILHSNAQKEYLRWKHSLMSPYAYSIKEILVEDGIRVYFQTPAHKVFTKFRQDWYPQGTKIVYLPDLHNLDSLGLAVWFMDDGVRGITRGSEYGFLCTDSFTDEEQKEISAFLMWSFGIHTSIVRHGNNKRIKILNAGFPQLRKTIAPHIIPSMSYKLGL